MTVYYKPAVSKNPQNGDEYWFPQIVLSPPANEDELFNHIAYATSATRADVRSVIEALIYEIRTNMEQGRPVVIPGLGSFIPSLSGKSRDSAEQVTEETIEEVKVNFRKGHLLRSELKRGSSSLKFRKQIAS